MYTREELLDRMETAEQNIKIAKRQLKRLEKARMICVEIELDNKLGFEHSVSDVLFGCGFENCLHEVLAKSIVNLKRYKKMLRLLDKTNAMEE